MKLMTVIGLLFSLSLFAATEVNVLVNLTPAGTFTATGQKIKGKITKKDSTLTSKKLTLILKSLKTGIDLRDEHFWEHLNTAKFPKAIVTDFKGENGKASANLEVNGVKQPIAITYTEAGENIRAKFSVKASSFKLPPKSYLGVGVSDEVQVDVSMPIKTK